MQDQSIELQQSQKQSGPQVSLQKRSTTALESFTRPVNKVQSKLTQIGQLKNLKINHIQKAQHSGLKLIKKSNSNKFIDKKVGTLHRLNDLEAGQ